MACSHLSVAENATGGLPPSRAFARAIGASHYFTGIACKHGHVDKRLASTGACAQCMRDRQRVRLQDPAHRAKHNAWSLAALTRKLADPVQRRRIRERENELHRASAERRAKKAAADKMRFQRHEVRERTRNQQRQRYRTMLKDDLAYVEARRERGAAWAKANKDRCNAKTAARRAARIQATPPWLTAEMHESVADFYARAQELSLMSEVRYEVDHIVPLNGESVCGLHVPWNLQILTREQNRQKSNRLEEEHGV
mgnify:CR=1 FL=1